MKKSAFLSTALFALAAACGGTTNLTGATSTTSGAGASGSSTGASTGAAGATSSSGSGGGSGQSVTITMDSFDVPPGGEVYKCQNFANPFGGADAEIGGFESHMTVGSHHLLLFYRDGATDGPLEDCSGLEFAATPYSTQLPNDSLSFPSGVAAKLPSTQGFRIQ